MLEGTTLVLEPRPAFQDLLGVGGPQDAAFRVSERTGLQIATLIGRGAGFAASMRGAYGIDLPEGSRRVESGGLAVLGTGPRTWLVTRDSGPPLAAELQDRLGAQAAAMDQSDGYAVLRLSGAGVRGTLAKGLPIDLHPRAFAVGDVAVSTCSHIGTIIWRLPERQGEPVFEVAVVRSMAASFWHWLRESAAEYGLRVDAPDDDAARHRGSP